MLWIMTLTPAQTLALSKVLPSAAKETKAARELLHIGQHEGKFLVQIEFDFKVGENGEAEVPVPWEQLALLVMADLTAAAQKALFRKAIEMKAEGAKFPKEKATKARAKKISHELQPKRPVKGKITGFARAVAVEVTAMAVKEVA